VTESKIDDDLYDRECSRLEIASERPHKDRVVSQHEAMLRERAGYCFRSRLGVVCSCQDEMSECGST